MLQRNYIGPAVWSTGDTDQVVEVKAFAGTSDGELFFHLNSNINAAVPGGQLYRTSEEAASARYWCSLLAHLHRSGAYGYWWTTPGRKSTWWPTGAPAPLPSDNLHVYFGVHPASVSKSSTERARISDIAAINCVFADYDTKDFGGSKKSILQHISGLKLAPSVLVDSGGGVHAYWLLKDPLKLTDTTTREFARRLQAGWVGAVGGDDGAKDLARVLRVPGTQNIKQVYAPNYPTCMVTSANFARLYDLAALTAVAMPVPVDPNTDALARADAAELAPFDPIEAAEFWLRKAIARGTPGHRNNTGHWLACQMRDSLTPQEDAKRFMVQYVLAVGGSGPEAYTIAEANDSFADAYSRPARPRAAGSGGTYTAGSTATGRRPSLAPDAVLAVDPALRSEYDDLPAELENYRPEDGGILDYWLEKHGAKYLFAVGRDTWHYWVRTHWQADDARMISAELLGMIDAMNQVARDKLERAPSKEESTRWRPYVTATTRNQNRVSSVLGMAENLRAVSTSAMDSLDAINLANGTLDLTTLELHPHNPHDHFTYCLDYEFDSNADCPRWLAFLDSVFPGAGGSDTETITVYQEAWGYTLTADTSHEKMFWQHGDGSNGKSTAMRVMEWMMGPLSQRINFNRLDQPGNYDLADLVGKRCALTSEMKKGGHIPEELFKLLVSGETVNARQIYGTPFVFRPMAKLWLSMNDRPPVNDNSNAIWRRMVFFKFARHFSLSERNEGLADELHAELPGILNWALRGLARLHQQRKFSRSAACDGAIEEYKFDNNPVAQWRTERTIDLTAPITAAAVLYTDYDSWCTSNGRNALNSSNFGKELGRLQINHERKYYGPVWALGLLTK